jgi:hypothetical protein
VAQLLIAAAGKALTATLCLALALAAGAAGATVRVAENLRFLEGVWSTECPGGHMIFFRDQGELRQRGFLILTDLSLSAAEMVPTTPLAVQRSGTRMVLTAEAVLNGQRVLNIGHFDQVREEHMRMVRVIACFGDECRETRLSRELQRCGDP